MIKNTRKNTRQNTRKNTRQTNTDTDEERGRLKNGEEDRLAWTLERSCYQLHLLGGMWF